MADEYSPRAVDALLRVSEIEDHKARKAYLAKLRQVRRREGRYLLRTNLCGRDPAQLWQFYIQLVEVEAACKNLKAKAPDEPAQSQPAFAAAATPDRGKKARARPYPRNVVETCKGAPLILLTIFLSGESWVQGSSARCCSAVAQ